MKFDDIYWLLHYLNALSSPPPRPSTVHCEEKGFMFWKENHFEFQEMLAVLQVPSKLSVDRLACFTYNIFRWALFYKMWIIYVIFCPTILFPS